MSLLQARPAQVFPAREGRWLVLVGEERCVLPTAAKSLLEFCTVPRTLAEHEAAFVTAQGLGRDQVPAVRAALADLVRRRLLEAPPAPPEPTVIGTITIPTRAGGSATLERCRDSFAENAREYGHPVRIVVSPDGAANPRRELWVQRLAAAAVPEGVARFLLYGQPGLAANTIGANRNLLLLESAGEAVLTVDDDVVCEWRRSPEWKPGLDLWEYHAAEQRFYPDMAAARASAAAEPFDVLGHCGARLGEALGWDGSVVSGLLVPRQVAVVQAGLCGDAATNSPLGRLVARGEARERLLAHPERWLTRAITAVASRETLVTRAYLMTYCAALDCRQPLVPFPPMDYTEDTIFAALMTMTQPCTAVRHIPWSVWHEPAPPRHFTPATVTQVAGAFQLGVSTLEFLQHVQPANLMAAAEWLREVGAWEPEVFRRFLTELRTQGVTKELEILRKVLDEHDASPKWWAEELRSVIRVLEGTLASERLLAGSNGLQQYLAAYGEVLHHWPAMWECARSFAGERE